MLAYYLSTKPECQFALVIVGVLLMIWTLRFATRNRPTCNPIGPVPQPPSDAQAVAVQKNTDAHRNESGRMSAGA